MRVAFRVDASLKIGSGHVMRCLSLANALTLGGAHCTFISSSLPGHMAEQVTASGHEVVLLPKRMAHSSPLSATSTEPEWAHIDWREDALQTELVLGPKSPDWLIVDHYGLDARWESEIRRLVSGVIVIDDLANRPHSCDALLDQNLGRELKDYSSLVSKECEVMVGPRFALLRPEFAQLRDSSLARRCSGKVDRILVNMGGVDSANATSVVLEGLSSCPLEPTCSVAVVLGRNAPWLGQLRKQAARQAFDCEILVEIDDMARVMASSDLAIGAAGSASWERCALSLPAIVVAIADNQIEIAKALQAAGCAVLLSSADDPLLYATAVNSLMSDRPRLLGLSRSAHLVTDGRGTERMTRYLLERCGR